MTIFCIFLISHISSKFCIHRLRDLASNDESRTNDLMKNEAFADLPTLFRKVGLSKLLGNFLSTAKLGAVLRNQICYLVSLFMWRGHLVLRRYLGIKHQIYLEQKFVSIDLYFWKQIKRCISLNLVAYADCVSYADEHGATKGPKLFWP
jgi:hypothetical protein